MDPVSSPGTRDLEPVEDFFARYTGYLSAGDVDGLVHIYHYPALAVTAQGCLAITDPQQTRDFFTQGQQFYRSRGIEGVRARDVVTDVEVPGIWVGRLADAELGTDHGDDLPGGALLEQQPQDPPAHPVPEDVERVHAGHSVAAGFYRPIITEQDRDGT